MRRISEKDFQATIIEVATIHGWLAYHTHRSDRSAAGFPDLVLAREPRVIFAELKLADAHLSSDQKAWKLELELCPSIEYYIWRPTDWRRIEEALRRRQDQEIEDANQTGK